VKCHSYCLSTLRGTCVMGAMSDATAIPQPATSELNRTLRAAQANSLFLCLFVGSAVFILLTLTRYPAPFVDEANHASKAWGIIHSGYAWGPLDEGVFQHYDGYWTVFPYLANWLQALSMRLLGFNVFSMRLISLLFGLALLTSVYVIGSRLYGKGIALVAALLLSVSGPYIYSSHLARHDVIVAAAGFAAIALYLTDESKGHSIKSLLAGLVIGLAFETHPNAAIYGPTIVLLYLLDNGRSALRLPRLWDFVAGGMLGLAVWAAMHLLPYPQTFAAITDLAFGDTRVPPIVTADPRVWLQSFVDFVGMLLFADPLRIPLIIIALIAVLWRGLPSDRRLLTLVATLSFWVSALMTKKADYYAILITPAFDLLLAVFLVRAFKAWQGRKRGSYARRVWLTVAIVLMIEPLVFDFALLRILPIVTSTAEADYRATTDVIRQTVPADRMVMADPTFWLGLTDRPFRNWLEMTYYLSSNRGSNLESAFRNYRPDYFAINSGMEWHFKDDKTEYSPIDQRVVLSRSELDSFLDRHARLVAASHTETFGLVLIYRIDWP
jgi:hypothetical protein